MTEKDNKSEKDNYVVLFKGAKLSRREANKVGLGIIFGIIGVFIAVGITNKPIGFIIILIFIVLGYFWLGNKIFNKKKRGQKEKRRAEKRGQTSTFNKI